MFIMFKLLEVFFTSLKILLKDQSIAAVTKSIFFKCIYSVRSAQFLSNLYSEKGQRMTASAVSLCSPAMFINVGQLFIKFK